MGGALSEDPQRRREDIFGTPREHSADEGPSSGDDDGGERDRRWYDEQRPPHHDR